ncbi:hypothetical protein LXA43DRAFT_1117570 [Ganoderma leucocontextum]|nr:hypothetical protein LXA43DRAFT_1117570 [Ganoderma leucocontextum]
MDDVATDQGIASEFVKYLTAQLKEIRDEVQRLNQENATLKEQLIRLSPGGAASHGAISESPVRELEVKVNALRKERDDALALAVTRQAEADTWRTRYEELKPQLAESAAMSSQLLRTIRQELVEFIGQQPRVSRCRRRAPYGLPATAVPDALNHESRVIFRGVTNLPLLSKAAIKACVGGFAFFGTLLVWCAPPSQHACVVFPEYEYNPKPAAAGATTVDQDDARTLLSALARKTLHLDTKNPKARSNLSKSYTPRLADLYRDVSGPATVQLLGLQRVGFNKALFDILTASSRKRGRAAAFVDLLGGPGEGAESYSKRRSLGADGGVAMETDID